MMPATCPHCGRHPYEYVDVIRGAAKPEVVCCEAAQREASPSNKINQPGK